MAVKYRLTVILGSAFWARPLANHGNPGQKTMNATPDVLAPKGDIQSIDIILRGKPGSPLVVHQFDEKAKREIRKKQAKNAKQAKEARDPQAEFLAARYVDAEGRECAPITALKKAIVSAATAFEDLTKVALRQALFVSPTVAPTSQLVPIEMFDGTPAVGVFAEHAVTIGINTRGLAYRPVYNEWQLRVTVEYNPRLVSEEQLLALIKQAGWGVGICEGRPEKSSALGWGRFERYVPVPA